MGRKKINTVQEEESLSEEVRRYPCLYDKAGEGYKDRTKNRNAWNAVDEALGVERGMPKLINLENNSVMLFVT